MGGLADAAARGGASRPGAAPRRGAGVAGRGLGSAGRASPDAAARRAPGLARRRGAAGDPAGAAHDPAPALGCPGRNLCPAAAGPRGGAARSGVGCTSPVRAGCHRARDELAGLGPSLVAGGAWGGAGRGTRGCWDAPGGGRGAAGLPGGRARRRGRRWCQHGRCSGQAPAVALAPDRAVTRAYGRSDYSAARLQRGQANMD